MNKYRLKFVGFVKPASFIRKKIYDKIERMKKLFHIVILFFTLALTLLLGANEIQAQTIESTGYVQNIKHESVVLISDNLLNGEISSLEQKKEQSSSSSTPMILALDTVNNIFNKNKTLLNGKFIHNLSTDNSKVHPIRAP